MLVLHGGRSEGPEAPPRLNLPGARMRLFLPPLARASAGHGVLLCRVRYRCRGWNGEREDAARDARWALGELARTVGELPVVVVGHSMGGRAALRVGGAPGVRGVVALAPWCPEGEPAAQLAGRRAVLVHGDRDRVTDPEASRRFTARAREAGADARFVPVPGGDHAMLRRSAAWHRTVAEEVMAMLGLSMSAARRAPREG
ncbi:alpha/beta fold hydrolase [Streptomyces abyssalis]|uniref:alpha/beta fold hydrolase n=1 Tax=Streptomyces abyssalis TaxID=933944 RepID=UPI00085C9B0C